MNNIIIIGDLHFGIKNFDLEFFKHQKQCLISVFDYAKENNIEDIICCGDFLDNRRVIDLNFYTLVKDMLVELAQKNITFTIITGNHDIYFKNTRAVSGLSLFEHIPNIKIISENTEKIIFGKKFNLVPWIISEKLQVSDADYVIGHFEIKNFEMVKNIKNDNAELESSGIRKIYPNAKQVFSGHFHIKSTDYFINYVGTPYQLNWGDFDTERGFFVLDVSDDKFTFIENEKTPKHIKLFFNESNEKQYSIVGLSSVAGIEYTLAEIKELGIIDSVLSNHFVKFIINESTEHLYDEMIFLLKSNNIKFDVINNVEVLELSLKLSESTSSFIQNKTTVELLMSYFDTEDNDLRDDFLELLRN